MTKWKLEVDSVPIGEYYSLSEVSDRIWSASTGQQIKVWRRSTRDEPWSLEDLFVKGRA